jgi:hypothetical protein
MFRASSCPSSGATFLLSPSSDGKPEAAAAAVVVAPDDGHEDAQNMSCI